MFKWPRLIWSLDSIPREAKGNSRPKALAPAEQARRVRASGATDGDLSTICRPQPASAVWRVAALVARAPPTLCHASYWYLKLGGADGVGLFNARARLRRIADGGDATQAPYLPESTALASAFFHTVDFRTDSPPTLTKDGAAAMRPQPDGVEPPSGRCSQKSSKCRFEIPIMTHECHALLE